ncbi:MAG TPA: choice-of-anchor tandem repeat GloVer-containing protein [Terriglobales bacterium]
MRSRPTQPYLVVLALLALSPLVAPTAWAAPVYKVLHSFGKGTDGITVYSGVTFDAFGNLYGTTSGGGNQCCPTYGTVFQLSPQADGSWAEHILHRFSKDDPGGFGPSSTPAIDATGTLYATTPTGGGADTYGTVLTLARSHNGWDLTVIHRFGKNDPADGPWAGVVMGSSGSLYGVGGCAFELDPGSKDWKETILHCFPAFPGDGFGVLDHPVLDAAGNLYGTTEGGGGSKNCGGGCGTVYELSPMPDGKWKETFLHRFQGHRDGDFPSLGELALDSAGSLYGATSSGTIFKLTPEPGGLWQFTVLYTITEGEPGGGLVLDNAGNLYGTTTDGGNGCGNVYKLAPGPDGEWTYTVLHNFDGTDGCLPDANMIFDSNGNLYGTTVLGGEYGGGVVFELSTTPSPQ